MGKKRKKRSKPSIYCYYCERTFKDEQKLREHQRQRHFHCYECHRRLNSVAALKVHMTKVHALDLIEVPNAIEGKDDPKVNVVGMEGIPGMESSGYNTQGDAKRFKAGPGILGAGVVPQQHTMVIPQNKPVQQQPQFQPQFQQGYQRPQQQFMGNMNMNMNMGMGYNASPMAMNYGMNMGMNYGAGVNTNFPMQQQQFPTPQFQQQQQQPQQFQQVQQVQQVQQQPQQPRQQLQSSSQPQSLQGNVMNVQMPMTSSSSTMSGAPGMTTNPINTINVNMNANPYASAGFGAPGARQPSKKPAQKKQNSAKTVVVVFDNEDESMEEIRAGISRYSFNDDDDVETDEEAKKLEILDQKMDERLNSLGLNFD